MSLPPNTPDWFFQAMDLVLAPIEQKLDNLQRSVDTLSRFNNELVASEKHELPVMLESLQTGYPSIQMCDLIWLKENRGAALVVKGRESCYEPDATVLRAMTLEEVREITFNTTYKACKVFYWNEIFG